MMRVASASVFFSIIVLILLGCEEEEPISTTSSSSPTVLNNPDNDWIEGTWNVLQASTLNTFLHDGGAPDVCNNSLHTTFSTGFHRFIVTEDSLFRVESSGSDGAIPRAYKYVPSTSYGVPAIHCYEIGSNSVLDSGGGHLYYLFPCSGVNIHFTGNAQYWECSP